MSKNLKTITTEVDPAMWKRLKIKCAQKGIFVHAAVREAIWFWMLKEDTKRPIIPDDPEVLP